MVKEEKRIVLAKFNDKEIYLSIGEIHGIKTHRLVDELTNDDQSLTSTYSEYIDIFLKQGYVGINEHEFDDESRVRRKISRLKAKHYILKVCITEAQDGRYYWRIPKEEELKDIFLNQENQALIRKLNFEKIHKIDSVSNENSISSVEEFFKNHLHDNISLEDIHSVDMNFHSGMSWLLPGGLHNKLIQALSEGIPFRIIVNTPESIGPIASHMRTETATYLSFSQCIEKWGNLQSRYPNLAVKVSSTPFIHNYHSINFMQPEERSYVYVMTYTYSNGDLSKNPVIALDSTSENYQLYRNEFEYLWNTGESLS